MYLSSLQNEEILQVKTVLLGYVASLLLKNTIMIVK